MLLPSLFGENLFDEMMNFDFDKELERMTRPLYGKHNKNMMKTDVRETETVMNWTSTCLDSRKMKSASSWTMAI